MSVELLLGAAGTFLGLANFIYWAWWSKRERIKIVNPVCCIWFMHKGEGKVNVRDKCIELKNHAIMFAVECNLVMTSGDKEIEIKGVYFDIDKESCETLNKYFDFPSWGRLSLSYLGNWDEPNKDITLYPKKMILTITNPLILLKIYWIR
ncbi:MAG: hypothetical protein ABH934_01135 [Chloroflexota bacterium]